jgi:SAM-dependent methyltransferase
LNCPLCHSPNLQEVYKVQGIPLFQNRVYESEWEAKAATAGNLKLLACDSCGFVFNQEFDPEKMVYDGGYQNEQAHSKCFQGYLDEVINLLETKGLPGRGIVEIGCGKGFFLERLRGRGYEVIGFDPAYEGDSPFIVREYFDPTRCPLETQWIILRHTLEHVQDPLSFLHQIASSTRYRGKVYIEVPDLQWIIDRRAFWDLFYEHCNYFTLITLSALFDRAEGGGLFGGQYLYVLAELEGLRTHAGRLSGSWNPSFRPIEKEIGTWRQFVRARKGIVVWGAGAKGCTFLNLTDPEKRYIPWVVDINPRKQGLFLAGTGHEVKEPASLKEMRNPEILIMNQNYYQEIEQALEGLSTNLYTLGSS